MKVKVRKPEKTILIVDYKSGRVKDPRYQDYNQLMFYAIFMFQKYPEVNKIKIMFIYVEHNCDNSIILERKYLDRYKKELISAIQSVENDTEFKKNKTKLCDWCGYKDICS